MYNSVIAGYSRSPFAMANKGKLIDVKPVNLLAEVIKNLVSQSQINPKEIEDVVIGCAFQVGEQCFNIGRLVTFLFSILRAFELITRRMLVFSLPRYFILAIISCPLKHPLLKDMRVLSCLISAGLNFPESLKLIL